jgi:hypothetical protein
MDGRRGGRRGQEYDGRTERAIRGRVDATRTSRKLASGRTKGIEKEDSRGI